MIGFIMKSIFGSMEPDKPVYQRFFDNFSPARNRTVIVVAGPLDAHRLDGALEILKGTAHARTFPRKKRQAKDGGPVNGYIPIGRRHEG